MARIQTHALYCFILAIISLCGCSPHRDHILFVTKTQFGVDVDVKPPTLEVGYTRKEGTISPGFKSGALPQMASFSTKNKLAGQYSIGQSFAIGTAAVILAQYYGTETAPEDVNFIQAELLESNDASAIVGTIKNSRPFFFGTNTSWGIAVTYGIEAGMTPESINFGYKRKELAYVAITQDPNDPNDPNGIKKVNLPSLLATTGFQADVRSAPGAAANTYVQFFATGASARYLAARPNVRNTIGKLIIGEPYKVQQDRQWAIVEEIETLHAAATDPNKMLIIQKAQAIFGKDKNGDQLIENIYDVSDRVDATQPKVLSKLKALREFARNPH